jgi:hypothetical protein
MSIFTCATLLGASSALANFAQAVAVAIAGAFVYWTFTRPGPGGLRLSVLLCATILAAPHVSDQDAVLLALSASLFLSAPMRSRYWPLWTAVAAAVWISPLFNPPAWFSIGRVTPVLLLCFVGCAAAALRCAEPSGTGLQIGGVEG